MDWTTSVDGYCERLDASFWSEPVNAISNVTFIITAIMLFRLGQRDRRWGTDPAWTGLTVNVAIIGVGSFLFHTFATRWAAIADVLPILVFMLCYVTVGLRRFFQLSMGMALLGPIALIATAIALGTLGLGAASSYLPALLGLLIFGIWSHSSNRIRSRHLLVTTVIFGASLGLRTLDLPACDFNSVGTHWLWHSLNAIVLYRSVASLSLR